MQIDSENQIKYSTNSKFNRKDKKLEFSPKPSHIPKKDTKPYPVFEVRKWLHPQKQSEPKNKIRVVQYNILADTYATIDRYSYCPSESLKWTYRKNNITKEILYYEPDVITLQEVDSFDSMQKLLGENGYEGIYRKRALGMPDGLAIFFKTSRIELLDAHSICFNDLQKEIKSNEQKNRMKKNNVALYALFQLKENGKSEENSKPYQFVVATTHIYWDPKFSDVKVYQSHMFLKRLEEYLSLKATSETPFIITGDFNSLPNSGVYELYSKGFLSGNHPDFQKFSTEFSFTHPFKLKSVYSIINEPITNVTPEFSGCLDYIWYKEGAFEVEALLDMIPKEFIEKENKRGLYGLPIHSFSSDHLALACSLRIS